MKYLTRKITSIILILTIITSFVGCSFLNSSTSDNYAGVSDVNVASITDTSINDSFVTIKINEINNTGLDIENINVDDIIVNCVEISEIESIEINLVSINDEFVYLAYKNFVSVYGDDFSLKDFLVDAAIAGGCIIIYVTLTTTTGPVGAFFGAILTSEFTTSAIVIGAAIDAAVSGYLAYQDGGDISYIIGHTLNGIADGFKWSAMIAPITGFSSGLKAMKAVKELTKIPGLKAITEQQAKKIIQELSNILKKTSNLDAITDDVVKEVYEELSKDFTEEVSEALLKEVLNNKTVITDIVMKYNAFNVSSDVLNTLRSNFIEKTGLTEDAGEELLKQFKNGTIAQLDDITDVTARNYIENNLNEFLKYFGNNITNDFIDNTLKNLCGEDAYDLILNNITTNDLYFLLIDKIGRSNTDDLLSDSNTLLLLQLRFGSNNINKLCNVSVLYQQMKKNNNIDSDEIKEIMNMLLDGELSSIADVKSVNNQIAKNMVSSKEVVSLCIKSLGKEKSLSDFLDDIAIESLKQLDLEEECAKDIIENNLLLDDIISKYGDEVYEIIFNNYYNVISIINVQSVINESLIYDLTAEMLKNNSIDESIIEDIMKGIPVSEWGLDNKQVMDISNIVAEYYRSTNSEIYQNYIIEIGDIRGAYISGFLEEYVKENTLKNASKYAGSIMEPVADNAELIKAKYGDIYMSQYGFPIFDYYAVARVESDILTGLNDGADDILLANKIHHGTTVSIPGYTWHHLEDGKTMILIPTELHEAYRHTGGASLLREGLKEALDD